MHELVVPRSIPKILAINRGVGHRKSRASFSGSYNLLKISDLSARADKAWRRSRVILSLVGTFDCAMVARLKGVSGAVFRGFVGRLTPGLSDFAIKERNW